MSDQQTLEEMAMEYAIACQDNLNHPDTARLCEELWADMKGMVGINRTMEATGKAFKTLSMIQPTYTPNGIRWYVGMDSSKPYKITNLKS